LGLRAGLVLSLLLASLAVAVVRAGESLGANGAVAAEKVGTRESASLILTGDGSTFYSANFDAGSVSRLSADTGERLGELRLGGDLRRLALSADERTLAVSDYRSEQLLLVDAVSFRLLERVAVRGRPFGVVYDSERALFWVTLFEAAELVGIDRTGEVLERLPLPDTPRGLALARDGRLFVTHSMLGEVSIVDVRATPPVRVRSIALAATRDADAFASQGLPRLLDDIAISPDQSEAWLPHVLWSFGHPFQFRSTIFPAVSVLSLEPGAERERVDRRKQLFRQIDLSDGASKTRIISNPHDLAFSPSGDKAYVTLAASEDLVVFDLSRRARDSDRRRSRRRGKRSQGGAQAIQIVRHLPGDLPKGLVIRNQEILVQQAGTLDIAKLTRGGEGPFARVELVEARFARLVSGDPVDPRERRGQRVFFSANVDDDPTFPLAGDFWMSCGSCHLDGFNFTNRYLIGDAQRYPKHEPGAAVTGHSGLSTLVAQDFVGDYIRMIQDTQGGLGADERMGLERVDPEAPPARLVASMQDLHAYVTASENLPFLSTWLRVEGGESKLDDSAWTTASQCQDCHSAIYSQWSSSNHHRMGSSHPYYLALEDLAAQDEGEAFRAWCMGCHNPRHLASGRASSHALRPGAAAREPFVAGLNPAASAAATDPLGEGTDCLFCHRVSRLEHAGGNASLSVNLSDRERYPFEASSSAILRWFSERLIASRPSVHADSYWKPFYSDPRYCGSCHSEFSPGAGAVISDTYAEWAASSYNRPDSPAENRTCLDCHMHADVQKIGSAVEGRATDGGRWKSNVRTHRFTGASIDLVAARDSAAADQGLALLRSAAELGASLVSDGTDEGRSLRVRVRNVGAGHHLPTGVADLRQFWLYVRVRDARGRVVLESGALDDRGRVPNSARMFNKVLGDADGRPVGLRFWRYATLLSDTRIPAGEFRDEEFRLGGPMEFPLMALVELRFRSFPRALSEQVKKSFPDLQLPPVHSLVRLERSLERP